LLKREGVQYHAAGEQQAKRQAEKPRRAMIVHESALPVRLVVPVGQRFNVVGNRHCTARAKDFATLSRAEWRSIATFGDGLKAAGTPTFEFNLRRHRLRR